MESIDPEELISRARIAGRVLRSVYEGATGEDLDLDSAIKHYPVIALALAASAGVAAGWYLGRRGRPQLPPPADEAPRLTAFDFVEEILPGTVDKVRSRMPEIVVPDEIKERAKAWLTKQAEEQLRRNLDTVAQRVETGLSKFLGGAMERVEPRQPDVQLPDPEEPPADGQKPRGDA